MVDAVTHRIKINLTAFSELVQGRTVRFILGRNQAVEFELVPMTPDEMMAVIGSHDPPEAAEFRPRRR